MRKRIIVVGTYGNQDIIADGQINKVRDYYHFISNRFGTQAVKKVNIGNYKRKPISTFVNLVNSIRWSDKVVLLLCGDGNGIRYVFPTIVRMCRLMQKSVYLSVVGGGLLNNIDRKQRLISQMGEMDAVYVETKRMRGILIEKGLNNVHYAPVFSKRKSININELQDSFEEPYVMCTYARVIKEKGISDAIDAVISVNKKMGHMACVLDVYGNPHADYAEEFNNKIGQAEGAVRCLPLLNDTNAIEELSKHFLLLFPTYYKGEGFPIALVESMKAGLPIIATDWHFNAEIVDDGRTGRVYQRDGSTTLGDIVYECINNIEAIIQMRVECVKEAEKYEPEHILRDLYTRLES